MHRESERLAKPDWVAEDGTIFRQGPGPWTTAQDWAMKYKLISVGGDPNSLFHQREYIPWPSNRRSSDRTYDARDPSRTFSYHLRS